MLDLLVRGARVRGAADGALRDIGIRGGRIVEIGPDAHATQTVDAAGALVTPALVEPHIHLDAVLTVGQPRYNESGSLFEGIAIWGERVRDLTIADVSQAAKTRNKQSMDVSERIQDEDHAICESVQRGLSSRAYRAGRLSVRREAGENLFHKLLAHDLRT